MNMKSDGIAPNAGRLLSAGFLAILAASIGFGIRGGIQNITGNILTPEQGKFLFFDEAVGLDGKKLGEVQKEIEKARKRLSHEAAESHFAGLTEAERLVYAASITGDRKTLKADSLIPAAMAISYLLVFLYFRSIGDYRSVSIE